MVEIAGWYAGGGGPERRFGLSDPPPPMPFGTHDATSQRFTFGSFFSSIVNVLPAQSVLLRETSERSIATSLSYE